MKALFFVVILPVALFVGCDNSKNASGSAGTINAVPVTAQQLFADYHSNEVAADAKYKEKWLAVTGRVDGITKDFLDNAIVTLRTQNKFMSARAQMDQSGLGQVAQLKRGQEAVLLCVGGGLLLGSPVLDRCRIAERRRPEK